MTRGYKTGGRPKGVRNKATIVRERAAALGFKFAGKAKPLDFMLEVLNTPEMPLEDRKWAAATAAPYIHHRLASIEHTGNPDKPIRVQVDDKELARRLLLVLSRLDPAAGKITQILDEPKSIEHVG